ncbi:MAG: hypothetical protein HPM95_13390 [Alphaproteobacteria bacterium]|nr:hypothetical protein [Alphaproteobacteria bacterium]
MRGVAPLIRHLVEGSEKAVLVVDSFGYLRYANQALYDLLPHRRSVAVHRSQHCPYPQPGRQDADLRGADDAEARARRLTATSVLPGVGRFHDADL